MASDQQPSDLATVAGGSGASELCPECGAASADPAYIGHANGCSRFYAKEER
jgi:hypothetical protein